MATKANESGRLPTTHKADPNRVHAIPLDEIDYDWKWNCRSAQRDKEGKVIGAVGLNDENGATGFLELKASLNEDGQREAVVVRIHPNAKSKKLYQLVTGYQRTEALAQLAKEKGDKEGTVRAIVKSFADEKAARIENLRENTARSELSQNDLVEGIRRLRLEDKTIKEGEIAVLLGKSVGYINGLTKISKVKPEVLQKWRDSKVVVPVTAMKEIADLPDDEQEAKFDSVVDAKGDKGDGAQPSRGKDGWVKGACDEAKRIGECLGIAELQNAITISDPESFFKTHVSTFVEFKGAPTGDTEAEKKHAGYRVDIVHAFKEGHKRGKSGAAAKERAAEQAAKDKLKQAKAEKREAEKKEKEKASAKSASAN